MGAGKLDAAHTSTYSDHLRRQGEYSYFSPLDSPYEIHARNVTFWDKLIEGFGSSNDDYGRVVSPFIGASIRLGGFVVGGEFSFDWTEFDNRTEVVNHETWDASVGTYWSTNGGPYVPWEVMPDSHERTSTKVFIHNLDWKMNLVGKLGYLVSEPLQIYALAGWTRGSIEGTVAELVGDKIDGWTAGGGLEYALGHGLFVRAEYRYTGFEDLIHRTSSSVSRKPDPDSEFSMFESANSNRIETETSTQEVRLGIAYRLWQP